jgi:WS/DGAT/MGAT family acyltransferase
VQIVPHFWRLRWRGRRTCGIRRWGPGLALAATPGVDAHADRLSALDAAFLAIETPGSHTHVGAVLIFEGGPLCLPNGGVDFERLVKYVEVVLAKEPRYRQRLARVPLLGHPVWVDDQHFNVRYHLRHGALPHPGDERQLKRWAARVFSQPLDRDRPLWEFWLVEGLGPNRFALITKVHHSMVDGVGGAGLLVNLLRGTPASEVPEARSFTPRPAPTPAALFGAEVRHRLQGARALAAKVRKASELTTLTRDVVAMFAHGLRSASHSPLNPDEVGPHRRFDWVRFELADVKAIKARLGGTVNDVALAIVSVALRRFLSRRGARPDDLHDFRAMLPASVRPDGSGSLGNHVALLLARLPVDEADVKTVYAQVRAETERLKRCSGQIEASAALEHLADVVAPSTIGQVMNLAAGRRAFNVVVTNVPGPPFSLYLLGARMAEIYPVVNLFHTQALGIAVMSSAGGLHVGLNGEWQLTPDLHDLVEDLQGALAALTEVAVASPSPSSGPRPGPTPGQVVTPPG